jgi:predicted TIM-barrel fold metal-dependent hydrolase
MNRCKYTYCKHNFDNNLTHCPVCGYPVDDADIKDAQVIEKAMRKLPVNTIIDMHQILLNKDGNLKFQLDLMDKLGIKRALLQSVPSKVTSIWSNRQLLEVQKNHGDRFIVSHFMDPRHPVARKRLRQYRERGIRVIKLLPCLGYQPDERRWERFWRTMEELRLVAMVHTGFITARHKDEERHSGVYLNSKYGRPIFFDILARKFPGIQFILCHMGGSMWVDEAVEMVNQHENVWGDVSGSGIGALRKIVQNRFTVDWTKLFWGNDSSPSCYPYNLRLLLHYLNETRLPELTPMLLYNNAQTFINKFLS